MLCLPARSLGFCTWFRDIFRLRPCLCTVLCWERRRQLRGNRESCMCFFVCLQPTTTQPFQTINEQVACPMATPVKDGKLLAPFVYCVEVKGSILRFSTTIIPRGPNRSRSMKRVGVSLRLHVRWFPTVRCALFASCLVMSLERRSSELRIPRTT